MGEFHLLTAGVFSQNSIHNDQQFSDLCLSSANLIRVISKGQRIKSNHQECVLLSMHAGALAHHYNEFLPILGEVLCGFVRIVFLTCNIFYPLKCCNRFLCEAIHQELVLKLIEVHPLLPFHNAVNWTCFANTV